MRVGELNGMRRRSELLLGRRGGGLALRWRWPPEALDHLLQDLRHLAGNWMIARDLTVQLAVR
jgi:hypothetical protein